MISEKKKHKTYDETNLLNAVAAVKNGQTYKEASEKYGIPIATIAHKKSQKYAEGKTRPGEYDNAGYYIINKLNLLLCLKFCISLMR